MSVGYKGSVGKGNHVMWQSTLISSLGSTLIVYSHVGDSHKTGRSIWMNDVVCIHRLPAAVVTGYNEGTSEQCVHVHYLHTLYPPIG